jgi:hypothetical protein
MFRQAFGHGARIKITSARCCNRPLSLLRVRCSKRAAKADAPQARSVTRSYRHRAEVSSEEFTQGAKVLESFGR